MIPHHNPVYSSLLPNTRYMSRPSHRHLSRCPTLQACCICRFVSLYVSGRLGYSFSGVLLLFRPGIIFRYLIRFLELRISQSRHLCLHRITQTHKKHGIRTYKPTATATENSVPQRTRALCGLCLLSDALITPKSTL